MKKIILNSWFVAIIIVILYDGFFFVIINLINPAGNAWTFLEFILLVGKSFISIGSIYSSYWLITKFASASSLAKRYALMLLVSIPLFCLIYLPYWVVFARKLIYGLPTDEIAYAGQLWASVTGVHIPIATIIIISLYSASAHYAEKHLIRAQNLATETQLKNLQQQIDPHFLFNSLNILSALIRLDTEKSVLFTQKLSDVYRFLLKTQQEAVISLEEELAFVKDYFYLIQCRFGNAFQLAIANAHNVDLKHHYIVPGTVQLLVENAIKHNTADEENPLTITITVFEDRLSVVNRLAKKDTHKSGYGLSNLAKRYELLNTEKVAFTEKDHCFHVFIPLLKNLVNL